MVSALINPLHEIKFWKYADSDPSYSKLAFPQTQLNHADF